jgi:mitogen-activated protein kinase kinase
MNIIPQKQQPSSVPDSQELKSPNTTLPRLRLSKGVRKKPAPKLNMNIPKDDSAVPPLSIFNNKILPALPPMPKHYRNNSIEDPDYQQQQKHHHHSQYHHSSTVPLSLNLTENTNIPLNDTNCLPSAATTLTVTSFSTLNDDNSSSLVSSFSSKLKLDESDEAINNLSDSFSTNTPTDNSINDELISDKSIESLSEEDWKILHEHKMIETLEVLGEGNGGSVKKCKTLTKNPAIFALKIITTDPSPEFQKQMVRELNYNRKFKSPFIVRYYGTFLDESSSSIYICMEYMGGRSLDAIYKAFKERDGRLSEKPLGKIASSVLKGLAYLNENKVMHRDIKPQNILLDTDGNVKLCDFGVSGDVVNSLATTFTGTSFYMAPERIKNEPYTISCDVWSVGLTVLEGALGEFPFVRESSPELHISPLDLLIIILEFEPILEDEPDDGIKWSKGFKNFIKVCLTKEGRQRPSPRQMLEHPWLVKMMNKSVRMDKLVELCWG